jgi:hypothetical protein
MSMPFNNIKELVQVLGKKFANDSHPTYQTNFMQCLGTVASRFGHFSPEFSQLFIDQFNMSA